MSSPFPGHDPTTGPYRGPILLVSEPGRARLRIQLTDIPLEIGRDCGGLLLTDPQISRRHLEVSSDDGRTLMVTDLGSSNGTLVDRSPLVGSRRLRPGETVHLGATRLVLEPRGGSPVSDGPPDAILATSIDLVAAAAAQEPPDLAVLSPEGGTLTIVFSDIEDSTRRAVELGDEKWVALLELHNTLIRRHLARHGGTEIKAQGDGFMLSFPSARSAVHCMIDIQRGLAAHARSRPADGLRIRVGAHTGEAIHDDAGDLFGRHVIVAARIANCAQGGEILVSSLLREIVESRGDLRFGPSRTVALKGLDESHTVHRIDWA
ncbi:MAG TPA: adenylate/guanylate cyclase domain-containing protein [Acidimicrobiales bacterium]